MLIFISNFRYFSSKYCYRIFCTELVPNVNTHPYKYRHICEKDCVCFFTLWLKVMIYILPLSNI